MEERLDDAIHVLRNHAEMPPLTAPHPPGQGHGGQGHGGQGHGGQGHVGQGHGGQGGHMMSGGMSL